MYNSNETNIIPLVCCQLLSGGGVQGASTFGAFGSTLDAMTGGGTYTIGLNRKQQAVRIIDMSTQFGVNSGSGEEYSGPNGMQSVSGGDPPGGTVRAAPKPPSLSESVLNGFARATNPISASIDFASDINIAFFRFGTAAALATQDDQVAAALRVFLLPLGAAAPALLGEARALQAAMGGSNAVKQVAVHGNSLKSLKPTWGYKLYSNDGTFLKNGITSAVKAESRYTKTFMQGRYMEAIKFPNRAAAYEWEAQQNLIQKGPLNFNNH